MTSSELHWKVDLGGKQAVDISVGGNVSCAITADGAVGCWGVNALGLLGRGRLQSLDDERVLKEDACFQRVDVGSELMAEEVGVGFHHVCVRFKGERIKCWGSNEWGQLGLGHRIVWGNEPHHMGVGLPFVDLGSRRARRLFVGHSHSCIVDTEGTASCWGRNTNGELGLADRKDRGDDPGEMGSSLPVLDFGEGRTVLEVAPGRHRTCALLDPNVVKCWGSIHDDPRDGTKRSLFELGAGLPSITASRKVGIRRLVGGGDSTCAVYEGGQLQCWGDNFAGQLGLGDVSPRVYAEDVNLGSGVQVVDAAIDHSHACAVLSSGAVKCWGGADGGVLGYPDTRHRGTVAGDMGDALPSVPWCPED